MRHPIVAVTDHLHAGVMAAVAASPFVIAAAALGMAQDQVPNSTWLQLGLASPLVIVLLYLLRLSYQERQKASDERQEITQQYLKTMKEVVQDNRAITKEHTAAMREMTVNIGGLSAQHLRESDRIVDAIGRLGRRSEL